MDSLEFQRLIRSSNEELLDILYELRWAFVQAQNHPKRSKRQNAIEDATGRAVGRYNDYINRQEEQRAQLRKLAEYSFFEGQRFIDQETLKKAFPRMAFYQGPDTPLRGHNSFMEYFQGTFLGEDNDE